ncbi:MAG: RHS repeat-associated core domain-containing protein [Terracoccus sp.]
MASRNNGPSYVARQEVNLLDRFESVNDDNFVAYTDNSLGACAVIDPVNPPAGSYYKADVITAQDYYPFGKLMPGRNYSIANTNYRYGFNGKENDKDIENGAQDYGMRIYDGRLGRFFSVDPLTKKYPELTPYQFSSNRVIDGIDLDGAEYSTSGKYFSSPEGVYKVDTKIMITINNSSKVIRNVKTIESYKSSIKNTIEKDQSGGTGSVNDPIVTTKVKEISNGPLIINLVDATSDKSGMVTTGYTQGGICETQKNITDVSITINGIPRTNDEVGRTSSHEQGHVGGLKHPFHGASETDIGAPLGPLPTWQNNLMNSFGGSNDPNAPDYNPVPSTSGNVVSPQQRQTITNQIEKDVKKQKKADGEKN